MRSYQFILNTPPWSNPSLRSKFFHKFIQKPHGKNIRNIYKEKKFLQTQWKNKEKMIWHILPLFKTKFLRNLESNAHLQYVLHIFLPKTPVGKNRRYDIYPCIDIASLKMFLWETPKEKLIKRKGCNMILNRLQSRGHSPWTLQVSKPSRTNPTNTFQVWNMVETF